MPWAERVIRVTGTLPRILATVLGIASLSGTMRTAGQPVTPPDQPKKESDSTAADARSSMDSQGVDPSASAPPASKAFLEGHIAKLRELQAEAKMELTLSKEQESALDGQFDAHVQTVRQFGGQRQIGANLDDANAVEEMRKKLNAAKEAGDQEELRKLTSQFKELIQSRRAATGLTTDQFIAKVITVLDKDQTAAFRRLIKRLRFGDALSGPSDNLTRFWRALLNPELKLSDEQRNSIHGLRGKAAKLASEARAQGRENELPQIVAEIRAEAIHRLSSEQQSKLDELLKPPHRD